MPQYRQNQCDHVYLHRSQCDQRSGQLYRRILAAYGCGRRSIPIFALPYPLRHSGDGLLLPQGKPGALQIIGYFLPGRRTLEKDHAYCTPLCVALCEKEIIEWNTSKKQAE